MEKERRQRLQPLPQLTEIPLCGRVRRDGPDVLKPVEAEGAVATKTHPEVKGGITDLGPDIKEVGALLLPAREGVGPEFKGLARRPAGPDVVRDRRYVPAGVPPQVPAVVLPLGDRTVVPRPHLPESRLLIRPDFVRRPAPGPLDQLAMVEVARAEDGLPDRGHAATRAGCGENTDEARTRSLPPSLLTCRTAACRDAP